MDHGADCQPGQKGYMFMVNRAGNRVAPVVEGPGPCFDIVMDNPDELYGRLGISHPAIFIIYVPPMVFMGFPSFFRVVFNFSE